MSGITAEDEVEAAVGKRQRLDRALLGADVAQPALARGGRHHLQHPGRKVVGHDLPGMRRDLEADVPGAAAQVEHPGIRAAGQRLLQGGEFGPLGMHGAGEVGSGLLAELALDDLLVLAHGSAAYRIAPKSQGWLWR